MKYYTPCLVVILLSTHRVSSLKEASDVSENPRQCNTAVDCGENPQILYLALCSSVSFNSFLSILIYPDTRIACALIPESQMYWLITLIPCVGFEVFTEVSMKERRFTQDLHGATSQKTAFFTLIPFPAFCWVLITAYELFYSYFILRFGD
jgi:hypothetical protein